MNRYAPVLDGFHSAKRSDGSDRDRYEHIKLDGLPVVTGFDRQRNVRRIRIARTVEHIAHGLIAIEIGVAFIKQEGALVLVHHARKRALRQTSHQPCGPREPSENLEESRFAATWGCGDDSQERISFGAGLEFPGEENPQS